MIPPVVPVRCFVHTAHELYCFNNHSMHNNSLYCSLGPRPNGRSCRFSFATDFMLVRKILKGSMCVRGGGGGGGGGGSLVPSLICIGNMRRMDQNCPEVPGAMGHNLCICPPPPPPPPPPPNFDGMNKIERNLNFICCRCCPRS